jgi:hypothetical protein
MPLIVPTMTLDVAVQGLPHMVTEDDVYDGYFIPAGSIIIGNTWCVRLCGMDTPADQD